MSSMAVNGLYARINAPAAIRGDGIHSLPPCAGVETYVVDEYPSCPDTWEHGSNKASSYFVALEAGKGMWFDFTWNHNHKHNVAVVISVQGLNPVTGKPITELNLVQHKKQCPVHKVDFLQDRYCPKCEFKWPAQNYISTTSGESNLWLDGFRNDSGEVRQYIISEKQAKGIAKQIEDKDKEFKRVWAIGFAFYLSKEPKPILPSSSMRGMSIGAFGASSSPSSSPSSSSSLSSPSYSSLIHSEMADVQYIAYNSISQKPMAKGVITKKRRKYSDNGSSHARKIVEPKKLEIGAGARIQQDVGVDIKPIDYWQSEPAGMIYVNFTCKEALQQILDSGKRQKQPDGPLNGLRVGN